MPDQRNRIKHGWFTTWQWAVLGAYVVAIALSAAVAGLAQRADENAKRGNAAICVQVAFLENAEKTTRDLVSRNPTAPETPARLQSAQELHGLIVRLREEIPSCREALK